MWPRRQQETSDAAASGAQPAAPLKRGAVLSRPQGARPAPPRPVVAASKWVPRRSLPSAEKKAEAPAPTRSGGDDDAAWLLRAVEKKKEKRKAVKTSETPGVKQVPGVKQAAGVKRPRSGASATAVASETVAGKKHEPRSKTKSKQSLSTQSWRQRQQQWSAGARRTDTATASAEELARAEQQQQGFELVFQEVFGRQKQAASSSSTGTRRRGLVDSSEDDADDDGVEQRGLALPPPAAASIHPPADDDNDDSDEEADGEEEDASNAWAFPTSDNSLQLDDFDAKSAAGASDGPIGGVGSAAGRAAFARWKEEDASHAVGNNFVKLHMRKRFKGSSGKAKKLPAYLRSRGERLDDRTGDAAAPKLKDQQQLAGNGSGGFLNDGLDFIDECLQVLARVERERAAKDQGEATATEAAAAEGDQEKEMETQTEAEEPPPPRCHHALACQLLAVKKKNKNHGRAFFACPLGFDEGRCDFFLWQDNHVQLALRQLFSAADGDGISASGEYEPLDLSRPVEEQTEALLTNLRLVFGHAQFRPGQEWAISRVLARRNTLLVLPTGAGKSLCYQLPALFLPGVTLVISPLISLMHDQFERLPPALKQQAACLASSAAATGSKAAYAAFVRDLLADRLRLVLLSPERALGRGMQKLLAAIRHRLSLVCVDEAHCVSEWSHHFRPSYLRLARVFRHAQCVLAMTATASRRVADDIVAQLARHQRLRSGEDVGAEQRASMVLQLPWQRSNLQLRVRAVESDEQRTTQLIRFLATQTAGGAAAGGVIVYVHQQRQTEELARVLTEQLPRLRVGYYHARMEAEHKEKVRVGFLRGKLRVVVATIAFGMGIDKQNVRAVVHYHMPASAENYLQQVGRAGRDGKPARALLFLAPMDARLFRSLAFSNALVATQLRSLLQLVLLAGEEAGHALHGSHEHAVAVGRGDARWLTLGVQWAERALDMKDATVETFLTLAAQRLAADDQAADQAQAQAKVTLLPTGAARCRVQLADKQLRSLPADSTVRRLLLAADRGDVAHAHVEREVNGYLSTATACFHVGEMALALDAMASAPGSVLTDHFQRLETDDDADDDHAARVQRRLLQQLRQAQLDGQVQRVTLEAPAFHVKLQFPSGTTAEHKTKLAETLTRDLFAQHELMERRQLARLARLYAALSTAAVPASQCTRDDEEGDEAEAKARELEHELTRYFHDEDGGAGAEDEEKADLKLLGEVLEPMTASMVEHIERDALALVALTRRDVEAADRNGDAEDKPMEDEDAPLPWTSLSVARVFHGLGSPAFPVRQWRQHPLWRRYDGVAFEKLARVADRVLRDGDGASG